MIDWIIANLGVPVEIVAVVAAVAVVLAATCAPNCCAHHGRR